MCKPSYCDRDFINHRDIPTQNGYMEECLSVCVWGCGWSVGGRREGPAARRNVCQKGALSVVHKTKNRLIVRQPKAATTTIRNTTFNLPFPQLLVYLALSLLSTAYYTKGSTRGHNYTCRHAHKTQIRATIMTLHISVICKG